MTGTYNTILNVMTEKGERLSSEINIPALSFQMYELKK
jgi:hypothetical protein